MAIRKIIEIDEEKCTGCGLCIPSCAEGALQIVDGKAKIVKDMFCDGLGACLGDCPEGALKIIERDADEFDEAATEEHLKEMGRGASTVDEDDEEPPALFQCPSTRAVNFDDKPEAAQASDVPSALKNWPVKIELMGVKAPYLQGANLMIAADCVPFATGNFHQKLLKDHVVVIGCPKLSEGEAYLDKLTAIIKENDLKSVTVVHMEVPCCHGLNYIVDKAIELADKNVTKKKVVVSIKGDINEQ